MEYSYVYISAVVLDPAIVVGRDVVPPRFKLVSHRPHELCLNGVIEDAQGALTESHDIILSVVV